MQRSGGGPGSALGQILAPPLMSQLLNLVASISSTVRQGQNKQDPLDRVTMRMKKGNDVKSLAQYLDTDAQDMQTLYHW